MTSSDQKIGAKMKQIVSYVVRNQFPLIEILDICHLDEDKETIIYKAYSKTALLLREHDAKRSYVPVCVGIWVENRD